MEGSWKFILISLMFKTVAFDLFWPLSIIRETFYVLNRGKDIKQVICMCMYTQICMYPPYTHHTYVYSHVYIQRSEVSWNDTFFATYNSHCFSVFFKNKMLVATHYIDFLIQLFKNTDLTDLSFPCPGEFFFSVCCYYYLIIFIYNDTGFFFWWIPFWQKLYFKSFTTEVSAKTLLVS